MSGNSVESKWSPVDATINVMLLATSGSEDETGTEVLSSGLDTSWTAILVSGGDYSWISSTVKTLSNNSYCI